MLAPSVPLVQLETLPTSALFNQHIWVDYIELLCLVNVDREVSKADLSDRFRDRKDLGEVEGGPEDIDDLTPEKENDKWEERTEDWFRHLSYRAGVFKAFYPFRLSDDGNVLLVQTSQTTKRKLYVSLLLSSNLGRITSHKDALTRSFELLSAEALKTCLPPQAQIHVFGTSAAANGRYRGNLWTKIQKLARDLREQTLIPENKFSKEDSGDNGLDIVGWVPFSDSDDNNSRLIVFGQCACTEEWVTKQHSSSADRWRQVISLKAPSNNVAFIPFCFRDANGTWHKPQDICSILVDRPRFIHLLRNKMPSFEAQSSYGVVGEVLKQREPLF